MKLDELPVEILHPILSFGCCSSAIALLRCNRRLHHDCSDPLVFKSIISNRNGYGGPRWDSFPTQRETYASSLNALKKFAYADELALRYMHGQKVKDMDQWLPQLMLCHHPILWHDDFSPIFQPFRPNLNPMPEHNAPLATLSRVRSFSRQSTLPILDGHLYKDYAKALCVALRLMASRPIPHVYLYYERTNFNPTVQNQQSNTIWNYQPIVDPLSEDESDDWDVIIDELHKPILAPESKNQAVILHQQIKVLLAVASFAVKLRKAPYRPSHRRPIVLSLHFGGQPMDVAVPTSDSIPFLENVGHLLPQLFSNPEPTRILQQLCAHTMTKKSFIEDGVWAGYYCISTEFGGRCSIDPPMQGIQFVASHHHAKKAILQLQGSGTDVVGDFTCEGELNESDYRINIVKSYVLQGHSWRWHGFMTVFGMIGSWGSPYGGDDYGGWWWLWKQKWTT